MDQSKTILIIDDDIAIRRILRRELEANDYVVLNAETALEGIKKVLSVSPDLILMELDLRDLDGIQLIGRIRERCSSPIVVITGRVCGSDKVDALDAGADDLITKPFRIEELMARIRARLRNAVSAPVRPCELYKYGDLIIDIENRTAMRGSEKLHLTPTEYDLFAFFCKQSGRVLTYENIVAAVWGAEAGTDLQNLRVHVANLRRKIEIDPAKPEIIRTESGVGFRIVEFEMCT